MASEPDPAKRDEASAAVQDYLAEQAYVIPLFEEPQVYGAAPYVHGFDDRGGRPPAVLRHLARQAVAGTTVRRMPGHDPAHPPHPSRSIHARTPAFGRSRDMAYLARRAGQALIVLAIAFTATFVLLQVLPGDAILIKFENPELGLSPEQIADIRA